MRRVLSLSVSAIVVFATLAYLGATLPRIVRDPQDFRAFYCAGAVVRAGGDPYLAAPLGACEDRLIRRDGAEPVPGLVVPAPLPGYALPAFVALSILPFRAALGVFSLAVLAAFLFAGFALAKTTRAGPVLVAGSLALGGALLSLLNGQIVPFELAALCASAYALHRGDVRGATLCAVGTAIEPHVGIAALLSLWVWEPRTRAVLAAGGAALGAVAVATVGIAGCLEYVTRVLPAHVRSEIQASDQYGLTTLAHLFGASDRAALALGDAQYVAMLLAGVAVARVVADRTQRRELLVTLPAAFALVGGPYIHLVQMVLAVPLLLSLAQMPRLRPWPGIALALLAVPWRDIVLDDAAFAAAAIVLVTLAIAYASIARTFAPLVAVCIAMLAIGAGERALVARHDVRAVPRATDLRVGVAANDLAERPWRAYEDGVAPHETALVHVAKNAPTWLGLIVMASSSLALVPYARRARALQARRGANTENARC